MDHEDPIVTGRAVCWSTGCVDLEAHFAAAVSPIPGEIPAEAGNCRIALPPVVANRTVFMLSDDADRLYVEVGGRGITGGAR